jgi:putative nucleotidyltransferase with HDIG domain
VSDFKTRFGEDVTRLDNLPSLPAVVTRLIEIVDDPLASAMDVAYSLREDPPLTARVLRMANSPVYGGRVKIVSVPQAVMRLGMVEIRNMVMSLGVIRSLLGQGRRLDYRAFWQHSLTVALATESVTDVLPTYGPDDDAAFAAGLLHDVGRFILDQHYPEEYDAVLDLMERDRLSLRAAERRLLGTDHSELGGILAAHWGLPEAIVLGVSHHHAPEEVPPTARRLPLLVRVAEQTCVAHGLGDPREGEPVEEPAADWQELGLDHASVKQVVSATVTGARKSALLLALSQADPRA